MISSNPKIQISKWSILKDFSLQQWAVPTACDYYLYSPAITVRLCYHESMLNVFKTQMKSYLGQQCYSVLLSEGRISSYLEKNSYPLCFTT